jgi:hypothetical protein
VIEVLGLGCTLREYLRRVGRLEHRVNVERVKQRLNEVDPVVAHLQMIASVVRRTALEWAGKGSAAQNVKPEDFQMRFSFEEVKVRPPEELKEERQRQAKANFGMWAGLIGAVKPQAVPQEIKPDEASMRGLPAVRS